MSGPYDAKEDPQIMAILVCLGHDPVFVPATRTQWAHYRCRLCQRRGFVTLESIQDGNQPTHCKGRHT